MPTAGYSGTPLLKKLGLKEEFRIRLIDPPDDYFRLLEVDVAGQLAAAKELPDWVHIFARSRHEFEKGMERLKAVYQKNTQLVIWVSWYKKSAGMATDMTEDIIRGWALQNGLVDIKVCAVSEQWSGLKLVVPLDQRDRDRVKR
jgi:hypothetical protein